MHSIQWAKANPERVREQQRLGYQRNIESIRARKRDQHVRLKYGITRDEFNEMLARQGGCKICGDATNAQSGRAFHVDHCHATGRIRGILCHYCNTMLGLAKDDPERLRAAIAYLTEYQETA